MISSLILLRPECRKTAAAHNNKTRGHGAP